MIRKCVENKPAVAEYAVNLLLFQGWTKFYEFSLSDLRAGFEIIDRLFEGKMADDLKQRIGQLYMIV